MEELTKTQLKDFIDFVKKNNLNMVTIPDCGLAEVSIFKKVKLIVETINELITYDVLTEKQIFNIRAKYDRDIFDLFNILTEQEKEEIIIYLTIKINNSMSESLEYELYEALTNLNKFKNFDYNDYFIN